MPDNPTFNTVFDPKYLDAFTSKPSAIQTFGIRVQSLLDNMDLDISQIETYRTSDVPIWNMLVPKLCKI